MTLLHVICGLGPPNQKSWLRLWCQGPCAQMVPFLVVTYIWQEDVVIILKIPGAQAMLIRHKNSTVSKRNHVMYHFSITIHLHLASFYAQNIFEKTSKGKCSLNKILNLN